MNEFLIKLALKALYRLTRAYYKRHDVSNNHDPNETLQYYGSAVVGIVDYDDTGIRKPKADLTVRSGIDGYDTIRAYKE